jgi:SAM-dependent methyltransferase
MAATADRVVATDINRETLAIAEGRAYPRGNVEFRIADAYAPEAVSGDFDCVVAGYFLSHVSRDRVAPFMQSLVDRVGRGGRVLMVDNLYVDDSSLPISRTDTDGNTYQTRTLDSGQRFEVLKNFYDTAELEQLARPYSAAIAIAPLTYYWLLRLDL